MVQKSPQITIIVASFNMASTLQRCLDSVAAQTYPHKEIVIIDGASTDATVEILKANDSGISYWESEPDRGIFHAWNKALDHASGEWICFLGADDYFWQDDVLEQMVPHLCEASAHGLRVAYGQVAVVTEEGDIHRVWGGPWEEARKPFRQDMFIPHQGVMHHRTLFDVHGLFDESFLTAGDYELLLRELKSRDAWFIPGTIVSGMQLGGISSVHSNAMLSVREAAKARRKNGIRGFAPHLLLRGYGDFRALVRLRLTKLIGARATNSLVAFYKVCTGKIRNEPLRRTGNESNHRNL